MNQEYHRTGLYKYSNVQGWELKTANSSGYPAFAVNGVVANWGWHGYNTKINPLMKDFRCQTIDLFSNEGGVLWNWVMGDKKYPSTEQLMARISTVYRLLRNDYKITVNSVRLATYHPKLSQAVSDHVGRLLITQFCSVNMPFYVTIYTGKDARYPSVELVGNARRVFVPHDELSLAPRENTSGEPVNVYAVQKFYD